MAKKGSEWFGVWAPLEAQNPSEWLRLGGDESK
jgi:hypothetical protein